MKKIDGGSFIPLYGSDSARVQVNSFYLDEFPVTNQQFREFIIQYPKWRRSSVIRLYAEENYLRNWMNDSLLSENMQKESPVTNVSWFAAKEYCKCQDKRLPTTDEWEYAAMASETQKNAQKDSLFNLRITGSYEKPKTYLQNVGSTYKNYWGIYDMHGLVWEWTNDFNSVLISGESRKDGETDRSLFCAAGSVGATDLMNYAAFMRYAFRGSLKANFCIQNLGFRCAKSINQ